MPTVEEVWACDAKRGALALCRKERNGNGSKRKKEEINPKKRWFDSAMDHTREKGLSGGWRLSVRPSFMEAYIVTHQQHIKVGTRMKRKKNC